MSYKNINYSYIYDVFGINDIFLETSIGNRLILKDVKNGLDVRMNLKSIKKKDLKSIG